MAPVSQLVPWDYVTLSILTVASGSVGFYHAYKARNIKDTKQFLVRGKSLGVVPLVMSSLGTFLSAVGMLGIPMEAYMNGLSFSLIIIGGLLAPVAIYGFIPVFYSLKRNTIFEYLELRFCFSLRIIASVIVGIQMLFVATLAIYAPALAINQVTGLHLWASVASVGVVCTVYTSFGGFKAVVWADAVQFVVIVIAVAIVSVKGAINVGGMEVIWERLKLGNRTTIDTWSWSYTSQYTLWTMMIACQFHKLSLSTVNQQLMQRFLSAETLKQSQLTYLYTFLVLIITDSLYCFLGFVIYAKYYDCDPVLDGIVKKQDQLTALFAIDTLSFISGLPGVFIGGVLCAALSTLSSLLNSLATVTISDYIKPFNPNLTEGTTLKMSKILVIFYGALAIALSAIVGNFGGIMKTFFALTSISYGPILTVFTMGMLLPWVNNKGAIIGAIASVAFPLWAAMGNLLTSTPIAHAPLSTSGCGNHTVHQLTSQNKIRDSDFLTEFYSISSMWYVIWCLGVGLVVSLIVSKITGFEKLGEKDPNLFFPIVRSFIMKKKVIIADAELQEEEQRNPMMKSNTD